jgi:UDP-glucose 4-epimerase
MELHGIHVLQVASSAEVYRASDLVPLAEHSPREPYDHAGHAHVMVEKLLEGMQEINPAWRVAVLRHFSIGGAHPSGLIGPSRLTRYPGLLHGMARASLGMQAQLDVSTDHGGAPDGSTICDFIHVRDVARAHVAALDAQLDFDEGFRVNVGSGRATSVLEMLRTFEKVTRRLVPWRHVTHITPGATYRVADTRLITELLGWKPRHTLEELCSDTLRWHRHVSQGLAKVR